MCNITKCCTEVCPEGIKITDNGIIPMKERVVDTKYDPVLFLGSKIGRRKERRTPVGPAADGGPSPIKHPSPTLDLDAAAASSGGSSGTLAAAPPKSPSTADRAVTRVGHATSNAASATASAASATARSNKTLPAAGAAAGVGFLAWALRRRHKR
jgi:succinate dehydrogenase / fumarate reductase, iron-sulfur subunit